MLKECKTLRNEEKRRCNELATYMENCINVSCVQCMGLVELRTFSQLRRVSL